MDGMTDDDSQLSLEELEAMPPRWRYDVSFVLRDERGAPVDKAAWTRAWLAAKAREEDARGEAPAEPVAAGTEATRVSIEWARSYQLAIQFEDLLGRYADLLKAHWDGQGLPIPEGLAEDLDEYREQFALSCCDCDHAEDEPHTDFRARK